MINQRLDFIVRGGVVKRFHTMHTAHTQNVAEHSFGVAWLVWLLTDGTASAALIMHALAHDIAEHVTGDLPAPAKRSMNMGVVFAAAEDAALAQADIKLPQLTAEESRLLKMADTMDLMIYCTKEMSLGNKNMRSIYMRGVDYLCELEIKTQTEISLLEHIGGMYDEARK